MSAGLVLLPWLLASKGPWLLASKTESDPSTIGPGLIGFLATFGIVVAAILLFRSMTGHLRKVDHRARRQEQAERDERANESSLEDPGDDEGPGQPV